MRFSDALPVGTHKLCIDFNGKLNDRLVGFYKSKYKTLQGENRFAATTHFEPAGARYMFPCWDEPLFKATFDVTLIATQGRTILSNMPVKEEEPYAVDPSFTSVRFETTPKMSTYLIAVVIGEFDFVEETTPNGVKVRVYTPLGKKEQGRYALHVATSVLTYYEKYFGIQYPLPKMDLIAIADFTIGAMENWGLITYRETRLLVDENATSTDMKQHVALTVAHEIAHMWFGNLVTMKWWTDLWLKEGYATFEQHMAVEDLFPEYEIWSQFVPDTLLTALGLDALESSHPIEVDVGPPEDVEQIFDIITYLKGASIIRMLHDFIGDDDFRRGMTLYLNRHAYGNAVTSDLWNALEESSRKPVGEIMSRYTKQQGFPLVRVVSQKSLPGKKREIELEQEQFFADGKNKSDSLWFIPLTFARETEPEKIFSKAVMKEKSMKITLDGVEDNEWIKLNPGTVGYYRTKYTSESLEKFGPSIKNKKMPALDRLSLLDDLYRAVMAGHASSTELLTFLKWFSTEESYPVVSTMAAILSNLNRLLETKPCHGNFQKFAISLLSHSAAKIGWDAKKNESHLDALLRNTVFSALTSLHDKEALAEAEKRFEKHCNSECPLPADLRDAVYAAAVQTGGQASFEQLLQLFRDTDLHEERNRLTVALGKASSPELLQRALDLALSDEVRTQDAPFIIRSVAKSVSGQKIAWKMFEEKLDYFIDTYGTTNLMSGIVRALNTVADSRKDLEYAEKFFREKQIPGVDRAVQQCLETMRIKLDWMERDSDVISEWLKQSQ